jgi:hypothetical protein
MSDIVTLSRASVNGGTAAPSQVMVDKVVSVPRAALSVLAVQVLEECKELRLARV